MLITLLIAFLSLIALMVIHEFGHFVIAKKFGVKVEEFGIGYPPRLFGKQLGQTFYSINLIPFGAFVKIRGEDGGPDQTGSIDDYRSFAYLAIWKRVLIVLGGVLAFWVAAMVIFSVLFGIGASVPVGDQDIEGTQAHVTVMVVQKQSPAQAAGLRAGDVIVSLNTPTAGVTVQKISDFQSFVANHKGEVIGVSFLRQGHEFNAKVVPRLVVSESEGPIGVELERLATIIEKTAWYRAPFKGIAFTWSVTIKSLQGIGQVFYNLFSGKGVPAGAELAGPVGITVFLANAATYGLGFFLYFIGSISVLVAIFNLFPIPALDGGKLVFLLIEKIAQKPVPAAWEQTITTIFFFLLIAISLFVTVRFDIPRVINFWQAGF